MQNQIEYIEDGHGGSALMGGDVANYISRQYSGRQIKAAGKRLREDLPYDPETVEVFKIANNWRAAHAYPMIREKARLSILSSDSIAVTAGRLKRMSSIRKKLRRAPVGLYQMQDLAGIRAIVPDEEAVRAIEAKYLRSKYGGQIRRRDDYIKNPKQGGYRSLHLVKAYDRPGSEFNGIKVEIQLRTKLQHVWATAVESVGSMRGEDMKAGEGDPDWLRFLELMSAYLGSLERPVPDSDLRLIREELRALEERLDADAHLATYRTVLRGHEMKGGGPYFIVRLNAGTGEVSIEPQRSFKTGSGAYDISEDAGERSQSVLVAVESMRALREAFPNYFLDVAIFLDHVRQAVGTDVQPRKSSEMNLDWLKNWQKTR